MRIGCKRVNLRSGWNWDGRGKQRGYRLEGQVGKIIICLGAFSDKASQKVADGQRGRTTYVHRN